MAKESDFHRQVLPNGMTLLFEQRNLPVISTIAATRFGSAFEEEKLKGIAHFIEHSVFKGTKTKSQKEISKEIEKKGGEWNAFTAEEETAFWIKIGSAHIDSAMDIISDIMLDPAFNKTEIETERGVILEEIKMYHDLPQYHVLDKLKETLYRKPFGLSALGTREIISKVPISFLQKVHKIHYRPSNMIVSIVGKAGRDDVIEMAKRHFSTELKSKRTDSSLKLLPGKFEKITEKRKSIDQAQIALGFHVPSRTSDKRYAAEVFNAYLGEGMSSPLFQEIREKRGLAYSVRSSIDQGKNYGYCAISVGTVKEKVKAVKEIILEETKKVSGLQKSILKRRRNKL